LLAHVRDDERSARAEFEKLGPVGDAEDDIEILQLYMDLYGDDMAFSQKIAVCDQILRLTKSISDVLQYNGLKAFSHAAIGELQQARSPLAVAVAEARRREAEKPLSIRAKVLFAGILAYQGLLGEKQAAFDEAVARYHELLEDLAAWTPEGRAMIQRDLGECLRYMGRWTEAEEAYRAALSSHPEAIAGVFLAECLAWQKKIGPAVETLNSIDAVALSDSEKVDHAYTAAIVAVKSGDSERMKTAIDFLRAAKTSAPYFEERRLKLIIELQEAVANGKPPARMKSLAKWLRQPLRTLSRYAILQPSVFGFGININAVIDDVDKASIGMSEHQK